MVAGPYNPTSHGPEAKPDAAKGWPSLTKIGDLGLDSLPVSMAGLPDIYGAIYGDGFQRMRHTVKGTSLPTGLLSPEGFVPQADPDNPVPPYALTPLGTRQPVLAWEWDGSDLVSTGKFKVLRADEATEAMPLFFGQLVDTLGGGSSLYWEILRFPGDPYRTLDAIVAAINGDTTNTDWVNIIVSTPTPTIEGTRELSARRINDTIYVYWDGHPLTGKLKHLNSTASGDLTCLNIGSSLTAEEDAVNPGFVVIYYPRVEGEQTVGSKAPASAYADLWLPSPTDGGTIDVTKDSGGTKFYFRIKFVNSFTAADAYYQVLIRPTINETFQAIQNIFDRVGEGGHWQAPGAAASGYLGISDFMFRHVGTNGGFFHRKSKGAKTNECYIWQDASVTGTPTHQQRTQFAGGDDGWTDPLAPESPAEGDYRYAPGWYRSIDRAVSAMGAPEPLFNPGGPVTVARYPAPEDPDVDFVRIWRTLVNGLGDYFKVADAPYTLLGSYYDDKTDVEIAGFLGSLLYNPRAYRTRAAGYPPCHRFLARHQGAIWGAGLSRAAPQTGLCDFTNGSDKVQILGPVVPTRLWVGRILRKSTETEGGYVVDVDEATGLVTMGSRYEGTTAQSVSFVCEDDRQAYATHRAETGKHNQWPARPLEGTDGTHEDGVTGFMPRSQSLFVWTRGATWVVTGTPAGGLAIEPVSDSVGLVNQRCLVVSDTRAYWLEGPAGFYEWDFSGPPQRISNPPFLQPGEPRGIQGTVDRINWDAIDWAHGILDPDSRLIRWFVPVDGSEYPNYCITYDLKGGTWGEDDCPPITASERILTSDGEWVIISGDAEGRLWLHDQGDSDGAFDVEPKQEVLAATSQTVTLKADPGANVEGASAMIISRKNKLLHHARVSAQSGASLFFREELPWVPEAGDFVALGVIDYWTQPNQFHAGVPDEEKIVPVMWVYFRTEEKGEFYVWEYNNETAVYQEPRYDSPVGDLSKHEGYERIRVNMRGYELGFRIRSYMPGCRPSLRRFKLQFVSNQRPQVPS